MPDPAYRTNVYIDGFNFYYGCVRGRPWKWLDLGSLFEKALGPQNEIKRIKYFTARVQPSISDPDVNVRQDTYLRALAAHCSNVELYFGHFLRHPVRMEHVNPPPSTVEVWKNEEKGSDVNLALHVLNDAWHNAYDCAVIVSNDSDLAEALRLVKARHKKNNRAHYPRGSEAQDFQATERSRRFRQTYPYLDAPQQPAAGPDPGDDDPQAKPLVSASITPSVGYLAP